MKFSSRLNFLRAERRRLLKIERFNGYKDEIITKEIELLTSKIVRQKELETQIKNGTFTLVR